MHKKQEQGVSVCLQGTKQTEENKAIEKVSSWEEWEDGAELFINARSWRLQKIDRTSWKVSSGSLCFNPLGARCLPNEGTEVCMGCDDSWAVERISSHHRVQSVCSGIAEGGRCILLGP